MATAMNAMEYDASALGNHEFNYGIDLLRTFQKQLRFPLLGANALDWKTKQQVFPPYTVKTMWPSGSFFPVRVGILGLTNPGVAIWDKANVENKMHFDGVVEQARIWVPRLRRISDVVVVLTHSGADTSSSYGDALPYPENASTLMAQQVPGIDAVLVGHAHVEIDDRFVTNEATGKQVLLTEPLCFGQRLSVIELNLKHSLLHGWQVSGADSHVLNSNTAPEDEHIKKLLTADHQAVVDYVNAPVATCTVAMSCATARYQDAACIDFINYVQADAVKAALAGTPNLPVLSIAAPFNRGAAIPAGQVSVRDVAGLYIYDNTLLAVQLTGAQVKDYLEKSVEYFQQVTGVGPYTADQVTNAKTTAAPTGTPDYNYDIISGLDAPLAYDIDITQPVGKRIVDLSYAGKPIDPAGQFVVAVNKLPAVRRWRLPAHQHSSGALQPADRHPSAADRLGDRAEGHRPDQVRVRRLEAGRQRPAGADHRLTGPFSIQRCPKGSMITAIRPYGLSPGGRSTVAPAPSARLVSSSTSDTVRCSENGRPGSLSGG